jgi:DNA-binding response OmpR family regulator
MSHMIVLAEDESVVGEVVQIALERAGYIVFWRKNGLDAWDAIQTSNPDLVILDYNMPTMSGLQVLKNMRGTPRTRNIPVLMATASGLKADIVAAMKGGATDYMVKPYGMAELVERVQRLLSAPVVSTQAARPVIRGTT